MKTTYFTIFFSVIVSLNYAQDTITKFNNEKIIAKILEISPTEIKYKKFHFLDGPTYVEKKSDIHLIVYSSGVKEEFEKKIVQAPIAKVEIKETIKDDYYLGTTISTQKIDILGPVKFKQNDVYLNERKMQNILLMTKNKDLVKLVNDARLFHGLQYIGFAAIPLGIAGLAVLASSGGQPEYFVGAGVCVLTAIACPIASGIFKKKRLHNNVEAIKIYNEKF